MVWGDLIALEYGKPVKDKACTDGPVPVYGTNGQIGTSHLPPLCKRASMILGRKGAYRGVHYSDVPFSVIDTAFYAEPLSDKLDMKWAYYKFLTYDINRMDSGSAIPSTDRYEIYKIAVDLPPLDAQKKAVRLLDSLDAKIRCNQRIADNLRRQAKAVYVDMFITHADPMWERGRLSDVVTVKYGKSHKKLADGTIPAYGSGGIIRYVERPLYAKESALIPRKGTLNHVLYVSKPFWAVDTMFYTEMLRPHMAKYVYHFLSDKNLASMNAGSAVPSMTTDILNALELPIPDDGCLLRFERIVSPMYEMTFHNEAQSDKLANIRNALLPRLMSGELDVSGLDL